MNAQLLESRGPAERSIEVDDRFRISEHQTMRRPYFVAWRRGDSVPLGIFASEIEARHHCAELAEGLAA